mmetsp:Transcript_941/g.2272  ORF Transcript_941/g.2272 Transcript_941/m.2272 type:complete len:254 (-) Transcript_941:944-1705(-)
MGCVRYLDVRTRLGGTFAFSSATDGAIALAEAADAPIPFESAAKRASTSATLVVSSNATPTVASSTGRRFMPAAYAAACTAAALPAPTFTVTVSKKDLFVTVAPIDVAPLAKMLARPCTRLAIVLSPSGPWYTAYIAAMFASRACAVQMFDVALSRRMCCSRVCIAMRSAGLFPLSMETPMMRPGMRRLYSSDVARKAACGPPYPMGTPKRCADPTAMSAPHSPGGFREVRASRSVAATTSTFASCASFVIAW